MYLKFSKSFAGPVSQPGFCLNIAHGQHSPTTAVVALISVIAEHEEAFSGDFSCLIITVGDSYDIFVLIKPRIVYENLTVLDLHGLTGKGDNAFDIANTGVVWIFKDYDVSPGRLVEVIDELIAQQALAGKKVRLHAASIDFIALDYEGYQEEEYN